MADLYSSIKGAQVQVPTTALYADSDGNRKGKTIQGGIYTCNYVNPGHACPVHIKNNNGDLGWIPCTPTGQILTSNPPVHVLESEFQSV